MVPGTKSEIIVPFFLGPSVISCSPARFQVRINVRIYIYIYSVYKISSFPYPMNPWPSNTKLKPSSNCKSNHWTFQEVLVHKKEAPSSPWHEVITWVIYHHPQKSPPSAGISNNGMLHEPCRWAGGGRWPVPRASLRFWKIHGDPWWIMFLSIKIDHFS